MLNQLKTKISMLKDFKARCKRINLASADMENYIHAHVRSAKNPTIRLSINAMSSYAGIRSFPIIEAYKALELAIGSMRSKNESLAFMTLDKVDTLVVGVNI